MLAEHKAEEAVELEAPAAPHGSADGATVAAAASDGPSAGEEGKPAGGHTEL